MANQTKQFDVIIIGAGHNGLVAAGYLARASTEKTIENIRKLSPHDAEAYPKFLQFFDRASDILNPILLEEPSSVADLAARFRGEDEEIYRYLMFGNLYDMLADYFESDYLRAAFAGQGVIGTFVGPKTPGSVYNSKSSASGVPLYGPLTPLARQRTMRVAGASCTATT